VANLSVATTCVKVTVLRSVVASVYQRSSRSQRKRSHGGRKRAKRRPIIPQMEGEEIQGVKKTPIL
jgi:hypothetical protein